jgi:hypothetical protein
MGQPRAAIIDRWLLIPTTEFLRKTTVSAVVATTLAPIGQPLMGLGSAGKLQPTMIAALRERRHSHGGDLGSEGTIIWAASWAASLEHRSVQAIDHWAMEAANRTICVNDKAK